LRLWPAHQVSLGGPRAVDFECPNCFFGQGGNPGENTRLFPLRRSGHFSSLVRDVDVSFFYPKQSSPYF
jgi:hypothetical protein